MIAHFLFEQQRRITRHNARVSQKRQRLDRFPPIVASAGWFCKRASMRRLQRDLDYLDQMERLLYGQYGGMQ